MANGILKKEEYTDDDQLRENIERHRKILEQDKAVKTYLDGFFGRLNKGSEDQQKNLKKELLGTLQSSEKVRENVKKYVEALKEDNKVLRDLLAQAGEKEKPEVAKTAEEAKQAMAATDTVKLSAKDFEKESDSEEEIWDIKLEEIPDYEDEFVDFDDPTVDTEIIEIEGGDEGTDEYFHLKPVGHAADEGDLFKRESKPSEITLKLEKCMQHEELLEKLPELVKNRSATKAYLKALATDLQELVNIQNVSLDDVQNLYNKFYAKVHKLDPSAQKQFITIVDELGPDTRMYLRTLLDCDIASREQQARDEIAKIIKEREGKIEGDIQREVRYVLGDRLGSGGMAFVYHGKMFKETEDGDIAEYDVAIKIPRFDTDLKDEVVMREFQNEMKALEKFKSSPYLMSRMRLEQDTRNVVYDDERECIKNPPMIVMPKAKKSLFDVVKDRSKEVTVTDALGHMAQILQGLKRMHNLKKDLTQELEEQLASSESGPEGEETPTQKRLKKEIEDVEKLEVEGMIHRDLKPDNILIGEKAKVHDFSFAKEVGALEQQNGTPAFMSPNALKNLVERADQTVLPVTQELDIYASAQMFYTLLTQKHMFGGLTLLEFMNLVSSRKNYNEEIEENITKLQGFSGYSAGMKKLVGDLLVYGLELRDFETEEKNLREEIQKADAIDRHELEKKLNTTLEEKRKEQEALLQIQEYNKEHPDAKQTIPLGKLTCPDIPSFLEKLQTVAEQQISELVEGAEKRFQQLTPVDRKKMTEAERNRQVALMQDLIKDQGSKLMSFLKKEAAFESDVIKAKAAEGLIKINSPEGIIPLVQLMDSEEMYYYTAPIDEKRESEVPVFVKERAKELLEEKKEFAMTYVKVLKKQLETGDDKIVGKSLRILMELQAYPDQKIQEAVDDILKSHVDDALSDLDNIRTQLIEGDRSNVLRLKVYRLSPIDKVRAAAKILLSKLK